MPQVHTIYTTKFSTWQKSINTLLTEANLLPLLAQQKTVLIKPNLVETFPPPITTPPELIEAIIDYIKAKLPNLEIIIGEGSGSLLYETGHTFTTLGYKEMAKRKDVRLIDLNNAPCRKLSKKTCKRWPEMYLPEIIFDSFLISVPVLKAHSLAKVTITMKNMMGVAPPAHYQQDGHWKKASFHHNIDEAIFDLNQYRTPDFTILDATIGMQESHMHGPQCTPPHLTLAASRDPVALDAYGANLLGHDWRKIGYIAAAHTVLGQAEPLDIKVL